MSIDSVSKTETPSVISSLLSLSQQPTMIFSANAISHNPIPNKTLDAYGLSVGSGGFRLADSGLNPIPSFSSLSLGPNPAQIKFSPGKGFSNEVVTEKPIGPVDGSDKKGKTKVTFQLPEKNGGGSKEDEGEEGKKRWNLRPRKEKKVVPKSRTRNGDGAGQRSDEQPKIPTRPRTSTRARAENTASSESAAAPRRPMFSLSLTKAEIEEDFIKMTGALPPKKPARRAKNVQKNLDVIFPGMNLDKVTPQTYEVPDPPLKR